MTASFNQRSSGLNRLVALLEGKTQPRCQSFTESFRKRDGAFVQRKKKERRGVLKMSGCPCERDCANPYCAKGEPQDNCACCGRFISASSVRMRLELGIEFPRHCKNCVNTIKQNRVIIEELMRVEQLSVPEVIARIVGLETAFDQSRFFRVQVDCPFCKRQHHHGADIGMTSEETSLRGSHCHKQNYKFKLSPEDIATWRKRMSLF